ncbi:MAG: RNA polymerase sigma factor [Holosporaceae bacterium]|jgi:RNA polymerase sigma-70 factor (ECF subfamily)|nr:sigma-70 family RNA polymerase sigma factor [Rhodospirillaceae bacterium]
MERNDLDLLAAITQGDSGAFEALVDRYAMRAYRVAYRIVGRREDAEDIVQDTLLKLWKEPWRYNALVGCAFSTWLYRVVSNTSLNCVKRRKFEFSDGCIAEETCNKSDTYQYIEILDAKNRVIGAINTLPKNQKQAINLCFYEEFTNREAAEIMNVSLLSLQSLLMRAKNNLKKQMNQKF